MKSRRWAVVTAVIAAVLLAACGGRADEAVSSGELLAPELSSEELLVSSLEYLLLDDTEPDIQDLIDLQIEQPDAQEPDDAQEEAGASQDGADEPPQEDALQGESAVIYYGKGGSSDLQQETITLEALTPDELISALSRHNILSLDTKAHSFEQGEQEGASVLRLDLSRAAGEYLRTMSREAECIIVASIANTFLENYDADAIYLTVEGETLATSNREYAEAIGRCTPEELLKAHEASGVGAPQEDTEKPEPPEEGSVEEAEPSAKGSGAEPEEAVQSKLPLVQEKE